jgi:hypothetical protein
MTSALLAGPSRRARARRATTRRFEYRDRLACTARDSRTGTRFASAPAARTASMVAHNDQVKGGRIPGFPHPVEPAGGTRRHGWGYREPRSSSGYTATVPTPVRKRRGRPCFRSQPVGHESFGHEQSFCPAALSMPPLDGESVARRTADAITPRGAKNPLHPGLGPANRKLTAVCMATVRDPSRSGPSTRLTGGLVPRRRGRRQATRPHLTPARRHLSIFRRETLLGGDNRARVKLASARRDELPFPPRVCEVRRRSNARRPSPIPTWTRC